MEPNMDDQDHEPSSSLVGTRIMIGVLVVLFVLAGIVVVSILI